jgi:hypothetical protein
MERGPRIASLHTERFQAKRIPVRMEESASMKSWGFTGSCLGMTFSKTDWS